MANVTPVTAHITALITSVTLDLRKRGSNNSLFSLRRLLLIKARPFLGKRDQAEALFLLVQGQFPNVDLEKTGFQKG